MWQQPPPRCALQVSLRKPTPAASNKPLPKTPAIRHKVVVVLASRPASVHASLSGRRLTRKSMPSAWRYTSVGYIRPWSGLTARNASRPRFSMMRFIKATPRCSPSSATSAACIMRYRSARLRNTVNDAVQTGLATVPIGRVLREAIELAWLVFNKTERPGANQLGVRGVRVDVAAFIYIFGDHGCAAARCVASAPAVRLFGVDQIAQRQ